MPTVGELIEEGTRLFEAARLSFGHGSDNARDEAAELTFFGTGLDHGAAPRAYDMDAGEAAAARVRALFARRVEERVPAAYLTHRMWFAGLEFYVDARVLVPRSPIAELIASRFSPWVDARRVRRILDIGTGSGCIAIACALAFPDARVDAVDVSTDALAVARMNVARHRVQRRVRVIESDVYAGIGAGTYDLIVSNPPYVSEAEMGALPAEYRHEPALGLAAGRDGLDVVRRILAGARDRLDPSGVLVVEVGDTEHAVMNAFPDLPLTWLEFEHGGGGVFVIAASELAAPSR